MKKNNIHWILIRLLMFIFLYSASAKILGFKAFSGELSKSPFLHNVAGPISFIVPGVELVVAILLICERTRVIALYIYLYIISAFLAYVYLMMNKAYYLPCACMGLFDSLGWKPHLIINCVIVFFVLITILLNKAIPTKEMTETAT